LNKRKERKADAEEKLEDAEAEGDKEAIVKFNKQTVRPVFSVAWCHKSHPHCS